MNFLTALMYILCFKWVFHKKLDCKDIDWPRINKYKTMNLRKMKFFHELQEPIGIEIRTFSEERFAWNPKGLPTVMMKDKGGKKETWNYDELFKDVVWTKSFDTKQITIYNRSIRAWLPQWNKIHVASAMRTNCFFYGEVEIRETLTVTEGIPALRRGYILQVSESLIAKSDSPRDYYIPEEKHHG